MHRAAPSQNPVRVHRVRHKTLISERVREAHIRKILAHPRRHPHNLLSAHAELVAVHLELVRRCIGRVGVELEGLPVDPSLDARGSERSLEVALADPAEGSHNITDDLDDSAFV